MRIAIVSDVHANPDALVAVLTDIRCRGIRKVVHLGDVVGYNTRPCETITLLCEHGIPGVHGNHDLMAVGRLPPDQCGPLGRKAIAWTQKVLTHADREYLASLPAELRLDEEIICLHSVLGDPVVRLESREQYSEEALVLRNADPQLKLCFTGHSHVQRLVQVGPDGVVTRHAGAELRLEPGAFWFVNPGSVGQPRDGDDRAAYAEFDPETRRISFHRVPYDGRRIARENARHGIRLGPRASLARSLIGRFFPAAL